MAEEYEEKKFEYGTLTNQAGDILINALQQDLVVLRRKFPDNTIEFWVQHEHYEEPPRLVIPRYNPENEQPRCRHCGEVL